jgi:hypothetical protein
MRAGPDAPTLHAADTRHVDTKSDISPVPKKGTHRWPAARLGAVTTVALTVSAFAALGCDTGLPNPRAATPSSIVIIGGTSPSAELARGSTMDAAENSSSCDGQRRRAGFFPTDLAAQLCDHSDHAAVASGPDIALRRWPIDCEPTVQRGHVPGALDPVLKIECTTKRADASNNNTPTAARVVEPNRQAETRPRMERATPAKRTLAIVAADIVNPLGIPITAAADATVAASAGPIVVADAYHGTGFAVCSNGERPVAVADSYHGTGTTVCPLSAD